MPEFYIYVYNLYANVSQNEYLQDLTGVEDLSSH